MGVVDSIESTRESLDGALSPWCRVKVIMNLTTCSFALLPLYVLNAQRLSDSKTYNADGADLSHARACRLPSRLKEPWETISLGLPYQPAVSACHRVSFDTFFPQARPQSPDAVPLAEGAPTPRRQAQ